MKKYILTITILFLCSITQAQKKSLTKSRFELKAKMTQNLDQIADCGYFKLATLIDFEIIEFSDKKYKGSNVGIIVRCPEFYGKNFFEKDKIYSMQVIVEDYKSDENFDYSLQNMKAVEKYRKRDIYWATSIVKNQ